MLEIYKALCFYQYLEQYFAVIDLGISLSCLLWPWDQSQIRGKWASGTSQGESYVFKEFQDTCSSQLNTNVPGRLCDRGSLFVLILFNYVVP